MSSRRASFRNLSNVRRTLKQMPQDVTAGVRTVIETTSETVLEEALDRVPVDSGTLKQNLSRKTRSDGLSAEIGVRGKRGKKAAYHGKFVEFGTVNQPAQPFLTPAVESHAQDFVKALTKEVHDALRKAGKL